MDINLTNLNYLVEKLFNSPYKDYVISIKVIRKEMIDDTPNPHIYVYYSELNEEREILFKLFLKSIVNSCIYLFNEPIDEDIAYVDILEDMYGK